MHHHHYLNCKNFYSCSFAWLELILKKEKMYFFLYLQRSRKWEVGLPKCGTMMCTISLSEEEYYSCIIKIFLCLNSLSFTCPVLIKKVTGRRTDKGLSRTMQRRNWDRIGTHSAYWSKIASPTILLSLPTRKKMKSIKIS